MPEYQILPNEHISLADVPNVGTVELKPLSRNQLQRLTAMSGAIELHQRRYEQNPDLLLDPIEYEKYISREVALQATSDAATIQMLVFQWGDRPSITTLELQAEALADAVAHIYEVISVEEVRLRLFRRSKSPSAESSGVDEINI